MLQIGTKSEMINSTEASTNSFFVDEVMELFMMHWIDNRYMTKVFARSKKLYDFNHIITRMIGLHLSQ